MSGKVLIKGRLRDGAIQPLPNVNVVAAQIAADAISAGLKTIVFVINKAHSISTARDISLKASGSVADSEHDDSRWQALEAELGSLKHSVLERSSLAVPHNASMLRLERDLAERSYRRKDGARAIVATPTLAQGLNLPAQLAILAGDRRMNAEGDGRVDLEAHELLNAAARAGRAGHLANGVVLLVPDPVLVNKEGSGLDVDVVSKLQAILPVDDRCVQLSDPLEIILDRLTEGETDGQDVRYTINRLIAFKSGNEENRGSLFDVRRSFAAFNMRSANRDDEFSAQLQLLQIAIDQTSPSEVPNSIALMSAKTGLPIALIESLSGRLLLLSGSPPQSVLEWVDWVLIWLEEDHESAKELFRDVYRSMNASVGWTKSLEFDAAIFALLRPGVLAYFEGLPIHDIEIALNGSPGSEKQTEMLCPRARELVGTVMSRGISYVMSVVAMAFIEINNSLEGHSLDLVQSLAIATRRGLSSPQMVRFAIQNPKILSRVQIHSKFNNLLDEADEFWAK